MIIRQGARVFQSIFCEHMGHFLILVYNCNFVILTCILHSHYPSGALIFIILTIILEASATEWLLPLASKHYTKHKCRSMQCSYQASSDSINIPRWNFKIPLPTKMKIFNKNNDAN